MTISRENQDWLDARRAKRVAESIGKPKPPARSNKALYQGGLVHPDSVSSGVMPPMDEQVTTVNRASANRADTRTAAFMGALSQRRREQAEIREAKREALLYSDSFSQYLRVGPKRMSDEQKAVLETGSRASKTGLEARALGVASGAVGGYLAPQAFADRIVRAQKRLQGLRSVAWVYDTRTGGTMPVPLDNDTSNVGEMLTENTQAAVQDTTFSTKTLGAYTFSSKIVKCAIQLGQDSAFDIERYLGAKLAIRLARAENPYFTTGTGTAQPGGVITGATVGKTGAGGQLTTLIWDDLIDLEESVDAIYRQYTPPAYIDEDPANDLGVTPTTRWMCNATTLKALKKIKDSGGRTLWQPPVGASPQTLNGYEIVINPDMASPGASAKSLAFGDFSQFLVRQVAPLTVLRLSELYADSMQFGIVAFQRVDSVLADAGTHPISVFQHAAS